jgi:hypothetical protein
MSELLPIQIERCQLTRVGAQFNEDLTVSEWMGIGKKLNAIGSCYQFLLGDWLNFGAAKYGEKYKVACEETELDYFTLARYASICGRIEFCRRRQNLTFTHHFEVAPLSVKEQDHWLKKAEENKWSVSDLRAAIRKGEATHAGENHGKEEKTWFGYLLRVVRGLNTDEIQGWGVTQRAQYKEALKPIVEFYQKL